MKTHTTSSLSLQASGLMDETNPPQLDRGSRAGILPAHTIRELLRDAPPVTRGLGLLWHDHWDAAHEIAQSDEGERDHDFLHAIIHRREGDFGNAGYWLRAVEHHPCLDRVAVRAASLTISDRLRDTVLPEGRWNARGFLDAVRRATKSKDGSPEVTELRALQACEMIGFSEWLTR